MLSNLTEKEVNRCDSKHNHIHDDVSSCEWQWLIKTTNLKKMTVCLEKGLISAVDKDLHWSTGECLPEENCFSMSLMMDFKHLKCSIHVFSSSGLLFFFSFFISLCLVLIRGYLAENIFQSWYKKKKVWKPTKHDLRSSASHILYPLK